MLGNGRAECYCYDGVTRLGHIRGKMRKKVWVSAGDIVLVGKRDYQDDKASSTPSHPDMPPFVANPLDFSLVSSRYVVKSNKSKVFHVRFVL